MSRLQKYSTIPSVASTSQEDQESRTLKVTLLSSEWKSSTDGDLSTINRELAIQLAKHPNVDVCVLLPNYSGEDRSSAESHNVKLIEADKTPGVEPVLWLSFPPRNHTMDCVIGHGVHLGRLIPLIKKNPNYSCCKWIQVVHSAPEEDGMYKNISEGEKMQKTEIQLCKMADQVITIGPKLAEVYKRYLCPVKQEENVFDLTPSIFSEFLEVNQATKERKTFFILVIGSGDSCADFNVKGYDIAAKAIAELKDESYKLKFVCAAGGKGDIADKLLQHGISRNQLIIRSFDDSREVLADLFCEVDLAIMPSRTEGFGIKALEALSAGLPVLVSGNSGLGEALKQVLLGSQSVVDSEDPKDWAREIKRVHQKKREVRLSESSLLREKYLEKYTWEVPCRSLVIKMKKLIFGGNEQVICNLQQWQKNASRYKNSSNTDPLSDLEKIASEKGYKISDNQGSGNCLFYALSEQLETVKGVKIHHFELRQSLVQYLREHPKQVDGTDLFHFVDRHTTWGGYLTDMEQDGTWGDHVILWAAANCYQIAIHVISSLPGNSELIIKPDCPFDQSKHLVLGHVHEVHYVSLQPLQEIRATIPGRDKRPAPVSTDQPHKQLRKELTNHDYCEGQNRHLSTEHDQYKVSGGSSTCYTGLVQQRSHPQGSSSYGLPAPVAVDYSQGNLHAPLVNLNFEGQKRHPSTEHDQNSFAGASSTYYRGLGNYCQNRHPSTEHDQYQFARGSSTCYTGLVQQRSHPQGSSSYGLPAPAVAVDYSQGNLRAPLMNPNFKGQNRNPSTEHDQNSFAGASSTYYRGPVHQRGHPHGQNRHPSIEHDQNSFAGASSTYCRGLVYQRSHPHGSLSSDSPAPVAVDYSQGNLPAAFVNSNYQGSQTFPQNSLGYGLPHLLPGRSQSPSASDIARNEDPIHWGSHTQNRKDQGGKTSTSNKILSSILDGLWHHQLPNFEMEQAFNIVLSQQEPHCSVCSFFSKSEDNLLVHLRENLHKPLSNLTINLTGLTEKLSVPKVPEICFMSDDSSPESMSSWLDKKFTTDTASPLLRCASCKLLVHASCYGVSHAPSDGQWKCQRCLQDDQSAIENSYCSLCRLGGGALKRTTDSRWVHIGCAVAVPEVFFVDVNLREGVNIDKITSARRKLKCFYCRSSSTASGRENGACVQCCARKCAVSFHVTCFVLAGFVLEPSDWPQPMETYCERHLRTRFKGKQRDFSVIHFGESVVAKHKNGRYYRGVVQDTTTDEYYVVSFDDGTYCDNLPPTDIVGHDSTQEDIPVGRVVQVRWSEDGGLYKARVTGRRISVTYQVEFEDESWLSVRREDVYKASEELPLKVQQRLSSATETANLCYWEDIPDHSAKRPRKQNPRFL